MRRDSVLIIEDEMDTARPIQGALKLENIDSDIAEDGESGIRMFQQNKYDLVLLDLKMPGLQGEEVLKEIRKSNPYVYVVIYTNFGEFADIKKLVNIGIDRYINKGGDADLEELIAIIKGLLEPMSIEGLSMLLDSTGQPPHMD